MELVVDQGPRFGYMSRFTDKKMLSAFWPVKLVSKSELSPNPHVPHHGVYQDDVVLSKNGKGGVVQMCRGPLLDSRDTGA